MVYLVRMNFLGRGITVVSAGAEELVGVAVFVFTFACVFGFEFGLGM